MKRKLRIRSIILWLIFLFLVGAFFVPSTFDLLHDKWTINRAVAHARSIRVEHYRSAFESETFREEIIAARDLPPEDFHRVNDAFPVGLDVSFPGLVLMCSFNPHHRIIITDASGKVTTIKVCFECDHTEIDRAGQPDGDIHTTPFIWRRSLRNFFASEGMPNSPDLYRHIHLQYAETNQAPTAAH